MAAVSKTIVWHSMDDEERPKPGHMYLFQSCAGDLFYLRRIGMEGEERWYGGWDDEEIAYWAEVPLP